jgi:hypothetical protein
MAKPKTTFVFESPNRQPDIQQPNTKANYFQLKITRLYLSFFPLPRLLP